ncbi:MAG: MazG family protein [Thermodesulfobacteriota bacterium]
MKTEQDLPSALGSVVSLIERLRGEGGCPWDRKQTAASMRVYLLEEAHELTQAIDDNDPASVCEELGDVLFQVFFLARLFEEQGVFTLSDVAERTTEKMIRRHPHVFGEERAETAEEVRQRWHEFKAREKKKTNTDPLSSVPRNLPALMFAYRICERASRMGHTPFGKGPETIAATHDRVDAFYGAGAAEDKQGAERFLGEALLALCSACFQAGVHPDAALKHATDRFAESLPPAEEK